MRLTMPGAPPPMEICALVGEVAGASRHGIRNAVHGGGPLTELDHGDVEAVLVIQTLVESDDEGNLVDGNVREADDQRNLVFLPLLRPKRGDGG